MWCRSGLRRCGSNEVRLEKVVAEVRPSYILEGLRTPASPSNKKENLCDWGELEDVHPQYQNQSRPCPAGRHLRPWGGIHGRKLSSDVRPNGCRSSKPIPTSPLRQAHWHWHGHQKPAHARPPPPLRNRRKLRLPSPSTPSPLPLPRLRLTRRLSAGSSLP